MDFLENAPVRFRAEDYVDHPDKIRTPSAIPHYTKCFIPYLAAPEVFGKPLAVTLEDAKTGSVSANLSVGHSSILLAVGQSAQSEMKVLMVPTTKIRETEDKLGFTITEAQPPESLTLRLSSPQEAAALAAQLRELTLRVTQSLHLRSEDWVQPLTIQPSDAEFTRFLEGTKADSGQLLLAGYVLAVDTLANLDHIYRLVWTELRGPDCYGTVSFFCFSGPTDENVFLQEFVFGTGAEQSLSGNVLHLPRDPKTRVLTSAREHYLVFRTAEEARLWVDLAVHMRDGHNNQAETEPLHDRVERVNQVTFALKQRIETPEAPTLPLLEAQDEVHDFYRDRVRGVEGPQPTQGQFPPVPETESEVSSLRTTVAAELDQIEAGQSLSSTVRFRTGSSNAAGSTDQQGEDSLTQVSETQVSGLEPEPLC